MATDKDAKKPILRGHAALFNVWTTLYAGDGFEVREVIRPGAFREAIRERQDVRLLFNHSSEYVLGRTASGTLELREDREGLYFEGVLIDSQRNRDTIIDPCSRGDLSNCSFAFVPRPGGIRTVQKDWGYEQEVLSVDLHDVSIVTYPAYKAPQCECVWRSDAERGREFAKRFIEWDEQRRLDQLFSMAGA